MATATEATAKPDSWPTKLQAEPGASTVSSAHAANSARATAEGSVNAGMAWDEGMASTNTLTGDISKTEPTPTQTAIPAHFQPKAVFSKHQVLPMVRNIHQRLVSCVTVDARLQNVLVMLAEEHPDQVVMSLLWCAPFCDRAAALMWRTIGSLEEVLEEVLPELLSVMEFSTFFAREDNEAIIALAVYLPSQQGFKDKILQGKVKSTVNYCCPEGTSPSALLRMTR
ncbi:hypothetical protein TURU_012340 [Turdus rufiventris]|nr:hypothetical protein TURU_012340 [Turdus rufiventris]